MYARLKSQKPDLVTLKLVIIFGALTLAMFIFAGCSTAAGFGSLMQGVGRDIKDSAEGTRQRMYENGSHN
jgi:predicted small secreted protein